MVAGPGVAPPGPGGGSYYGARDPRGPPPAAEAPPPGGDYYGAQDRYDPGARPQRYDEYPQAGQPDQLPEPSRQAPPPGGAPPGAPAYAQ